MAVLLAAGIGLAAQGPQQSPYPIYNPETFVATMKTVAQNFAGLTQAVDRGEFEEAKSRAVRTREQLATTITFWRKNRKDDAVAMLRTATARLDDLDATLSKSPVDRPSAAAAVARIDAACQACHAAYRERDPATNAYRVKTP